MLASFLLFLLLTIYSAQTERSFKIDYENDQFLKDGKPFRYISGSIHYSRVQPYYWKDRLLKMRAGGLNAIHFYVPWNAHEISPGIYDFAGINNVTGFLDIAHELGLVVIARIGPYTCGEWENGGIPWWLFKMGGIKVRTADPRFITAVTRWYSVLLPQLLPYLYKNGGPIILVQIENEYGSFDACDVKYTTFLRDYVRKYFGYDTQLITDDGGGLGYLKCGFIPDVYPTVDGGNIQSGFAAQRVYAPRGPLVNTEYYPGWFDEWGSNWSYVATKPILDGISLMHKMNASFNFYMYLGGSNFGFWAENPVTQSYDYDAPLSEAGDPRPKYYAIRKLIQELRNVTLPPVPGPTTKIAYGSVAMKYLGTILSFLDILSPPSQRVNSAYPISMENLSFPYGFILYETTIKNNGTKLEGKTVKDRGYVMLNGCFVGTFIFKSNTTVNLKTKVGDKLQILLENMGRVAHAGFNSKGILSNITLDGKVLTNWTMYKIHLENLPPIANRIRPQISDSECWLPSFYGGSFSTKSKGIGDTFMSPDEWGKGQYFMNSDNVGRYWPSKGPQVTIYTPKTFLKDYNIVILFELEKAPAQKAVNFTSKPYLDKPVYKDD